MKSITIQFSDRQYGIISTFAQAKEQTGEEYITEALSIHVDADLQAQAGALFGLGYRGDYEDWMELTADPPPAK